MAEMNTRITVFVQGFYSATGKDPARLIQRWLNEQATGDFNNRWAALVAAASA